MTNVVAHMSGVAICARLDQHLVELSLAIDADDPLRITAVDHALRNDAMALFGLLSIEDVTSTPILDMLDRIVVSLRIAATKLSLQSAESTQSNNRNLIYLKVDNLRRTGK